MSTPHVLFETENAVAFITFNRPDARNAMTFEMYEALVEACDRVDADETVRVLVLEGPGARRSSPAPISTSLRVSARARMRWSTSFGSTA